MKNLTLLGSTGSIGTQTLEVVKNLKQWNITALTANTSIELLEKQAREFNPDYLVIKDKELALKLKKNLSSFKNIEILSGTSGLKTVSSLSEVDMVINALVGAAGLEPSLTALKADKKLGLANKESMVAGGKLIKNLSNSDKIYPIDSEHNAVYRVLEGKADTEIKNIWLTASGGPFYDLSLEELKQVTVEEALDHPNWDMGPKITIDSASLMNKGLEVIEAHWLFDIDYDKIQVVIHPESIIHSLVEFIDNSWEAELGAADMKIPIQYVLSYPRIEEAAGTAFDIFNSGSFNFLKPDTDRFPLLDLAYQAGKTGESMPVVLNAANEVAVSAFLKEKISFLKIPQIIEKIMEKHSLQKINKLEDVFKIDTEVRCRTEEVINEC